MNELSQHEIDDLRVSMRDYVDARLHSIEIARKAESETLKAKLETMNEFRAAMQDQAIKFLTRDEYNIHHQHIVDEIGRLREFKASIDGKADQKAVMIGYMFSALAAIIGIIGIVEALTR